jgi:hypothetical protein
MSTDPARVELFRDVVQDLWARTPDGRIWLNAVATFGTPAEGAPGWEGPATPDRTWEFIERTWGPLTPVTGETRATHVAAVAELADRIPFRGAPG